MHETNPALTHSYLCNSRGRHSHVHQYGGSTSNTAQQIEQEALEGMLHGLHANNLIMHGYFGCRI